MFTCVCSYECRHVYHATRVVYACSHVCVCSCECRHMHTMPYAWCVFTCMCSVSAGTYVPCHMCGVHVFTCVCVPVSAGIRVPCHMHGDQRTASGVSPLLPLCLVIHVCQLASRLSPTTVPLGNTGIRDSKLGFLCLLYKRLSF